MARLRNRIRKADYWTDGELMKWPRDKRATYSGLWAIAEDSGCLEFDCWEWKYLLWPADDDITIPMLETWRDELIECGKLVVYEVDAKKYLFIRSFHKHEHPRNPASPNLPLPPWVVWIPGSREAKERARYEVDLDGIGTAAKPQRKAAAKPKTEVAVVEPDDSFDVFWAAYPNKEGKKAAALKWKRLTKEQRAKAIVVAQAMKRGVDAGVQEAKFCPHPTTFINGERWEDWSDGPPPAWQNGGGKRGGLTAEQILAQAQALKDRGE